MSVARFEKRLRPAATATISPMRRRTAAHRDHLIEVVVKLTQDGTKYADRDHVEGVVGEALGAFPSANGEAARRRYSEGMKSTAARGTSVSTVSSVDASIVWPDRPADELVEQLRRALVDAGYRLVLREKRECAELGCSTEAMVDWNRMGEVPVGWFSNLLCGAHHYRLCGKCKSTYRMSSTNCAAAAPSLRCQVCGVIIVEWGSSKVWQAELVTMGG